MGFAVPAEEDMRLSRRSIVWFTTLAVLSSLEFAVAQNTSPQPPSQTPSAPAVSAASVPPPPAEVAANQSNQKMYVVPAGTKILLQLRSAINTKSAKVGDGVYLESSFPVVVGNRVMIPSGVYVQGTVDRVERAGHMSGKSQLDMHFTSIIFPNGSVVEVPGMVNNLPGATDQTVKDDGEGTVEQNPNKTRNAGKVAQVALPTGATIGTITGIHSGHPLAGGLGGLAAGAAAIGIATLFTRGADVNIPKDTQVEMVLQRPLYLEDANVAGSNVAAPAPNLVPSKSQPKPIDKPNHERVLCPPGGLGCN
jgi:type IV secretion system protein VirB10